MMNTKGFCKDHQETVPIKDPMTERERERGT